MASQIITVVLFTVVFAEALTLLCYNCPTPVPPATCAQTANCSSNSQCSSITTYAGDVLKSCTDSCVNWSINVGLYIMSSQCCASDLCNNATASDSENGKMCYTCSDTNCSNTQTLRCKGGEDQCVTATVELNGTDYTFKGCLSQNLCDNSALLDPALPTGLTILHYSCFEANTSNMTPRPV